MNKDGGFIKLYRSILDWEWIDDPNTVATYVYCLARANHATGKWHGEIIQPGQFLTSYAHMAKKLGLTVNQLRTAIKHLKSTHNITCQSTHAGTLVTVENYGMYQSAGEKTTNRITHVVTNEAQTDHKQTTTNKKEREGKEGEEREIYRESASLLRQNHEAFKAIKDALMKGEA